VEIFSTSEFWSAIAGAIVGGIIAFSIQIIALRESRKQNTSKIDERRKALAYSVMFKTLKIHSHLVQLRDEIEKSFQKPFEQAQPWQFFRPLVNRPQHVHFSSDEIALVLSLKEDDLLNLLIILDETHNDTIELFGTYARLRVELTSRLSAEMNGMVGTTTLTQQEMMLLAPKMAELNELIVGLRQRCTKDAEASGKATANLNKALNKHVALNLRFEDLKT
jgi:hypothetical protein